MPDVAMQATPASTAASITAPANCLEPFPIEPQVHSALGVLFFARPLLALYTRSLPLPVLVAGVGAVT